MQQSNQNDTVTVEILDKNYTVKCPDGSHNSLQRAATHLDKTMREARGDNKLANVERIAVLAALNITHELLDLKKELKKIPKDYTNRVKTISKEFENLLTQKEQIEL